MTTALTALTAFEVNSLDPNSRTLELGTVASSRPGGYWPVVTQDAAPQTARYQHVGFSSVMAAAAKLGPPPRGVPR